MRFKAVRAPLGPKRTVSTWLGAGRYKMVSESIPDLGVGFVWPRNPMGHNENVVSAWRGVCDVPNRIWENVPGAIYVETLFNQVGSF